MNDPGKSREIMTTETLERLQSSFELTQKNQPLHDSVRQSLENYISQLKGQLPSNLYELILAEVEAPLMEAVMEYTKGNQSRAAIVLGLSRGTLRKKLKMYGLLD
nr:DNA-binding transcriptional regulator Fis [Aquicella siphonis]